MTNQQIPIGFTIRSKNHTKRLVYKPNWSQELPWCSYIDGTAGRQFKSVQEAIDNGFTDLESDQDREEQRKYHASYQELIVPLPSIPETNHLTSQKLT